MYQDIRGFYEEKDEPSWKETPKQKAYRLGNYWLYLANLAGERGNTELEQRHLARGQKWLDKLNVLDGLVE